MIMRLYRKSRHLQVRNFTEKVSIDKIPSLKEFMQASEPDSQIQL